MTTSPTSSPQPHISLIVNRDEEHLRLLGLYHIVLAVLHGITLIVFVLLPLIIGPAYYAGMGKTLPADPKALQQVLVFSLLIRGIIIFMIAMNGLSIRKKQHWLTCVILSILECSALVLIGDMMSLVLGISAILTLRRESVKAVFRANQLKD